MFHNKLLIIKCYYNFLDFQMFYSDRTFDFENLLMVLDSLASFHFESLAYYVVIILQCIRRVNFNSLTFSYIFQALFFQSHIYFYSRLIELSINVQKNPGPKPDQSFSICHWNLNSIAALLIIAFTILRLFVFLKRISFLTFHLIKRIWIYQVTD